MRSNSSATMSATEGSTRSRSANRAQKVCSIRWRPSECGSMPSSGRAKRTSQCQSRRTKATAGLSSAIPPTRSGRCEADLDRHPPAHAVADEVGALDPERVHRADDGVGEVARAVGRRRGLGGAAEARQVDRVDGVAAAERGGGVEEARLGRPEAVQEQHVGPFAHRQRADPELADRHVVDRAAAAGGRRGAGTGPRSRPRGRGPRARRGGAGRTPRRRRARLRAAAATSRRRCRSRRRARAGSPRRARGRRSWCSGPPSCGRCRRAGRGTWRRSPAPPRGSGTAASGTPPRRAPTRSGIGGPYPAAGRIRSVACPTSRSTTPEPAHCSRFRRATPPRWGSTHAGRRCTRACTSATRGRSSSSASSSASSSTRATASRWSATSPTSTTRSTTRRGRPAGRPASWRRRWPRPTARTPTGSAWAARTPSRSRPSTSGRSSR